MRILRSYEKGETVSIDILRKQKRSTVTWKVPSREDRFWRLHEGTDDREEQSWMPRVKVRRLHLQRV